MSEKQMIHDAMVAIMKDTDAIAKDQRNAAQGFNFRGIDQVYDALHPVFAKHGVFLLTEVLDHQKVEKQTRNGGLALHHFLTVKFRFVARDGSSVESILLGEAADSGDKGINKCLSIALKYCLFQALLIPLADDCDPDKHATEFAKPTQPPPPMRQTGPQASQGQPQQRSAPQPATAGDPDTFTGTAEQKAALTSLIKRQLPYEKQNFPLYQTIFQKAINRHINELPDIIQEVLTSEQQ